MATQYVEPISVEPEAFYTNLGVQWYAGGTFQREPKRGADMKATRLYRVKPGQFVYNRMFVTEGSFALVAADHADGVVSNEFPLFDVNCAVMLPEYLSLHFQQPSVWAGIAAQATGTTKSRRRWKESQFNEYRFSFPSLVEQRRIVDLIAAVDDAIETANEEATASSAAAAGLREVWFGADEQTILAGEAYDIAAGKQLQRSVQIGDRVPYIRAANLSANQVDVSDVNVMYATDRDVEKLSLLEGDVLIVEGGFGYGKTAVWRNELPSPVIFQNHVLRVRSKNHRYSSQYASMWAKWCYEAGRWRPTGTELLNIGVGNARRMLLRSRESDGLPSLLQSAWALDEAANAARATADALRTLRSNLLTALLSGEHEIPSSYDKFLTLNEEAAA
ncbi:hypothetical protein [Microbacterium sp. LWO13-1.2]|uniref:hypothetical protein n=1 Tax=Microbacterium sp. LWO13-1.2 TaxID=3135262 RepID=UPI00313904A5